MLIRCNSKSWHKIALMGEQFDKLNVTLCWPRLGVMRSLNFSFNAVTIAIVFGVLQRAHYTNTKTNIDH